MKRFIENLIVIGVIVLLVAGVFYAGAQAKAVSSSVFFYESEWTVIPTNQIVSFEHNLGSLPSDINIWVAQLVGTNTTMDFTEAIPYTDEYLRCIRVNNVNQNTITVFNICDGLEIIRVDAVLFQP